MPYYSSNVFTTDYSQNYLHNRHSCDSPTCSLPLLASSLLITLCIIHFIAFIFHQAILASFSDSLLLSTVNKELAASIAMCHTAIFCYGYIAMILIIIKSYSKQSFGINIRLLIYCGITTYS